MSKGDTVQACLALFGVDLVSLAACGSVCDEWKAIKKGYFKTILMCHPDKGGDASVFRDVQSAFEVMRVLFDSGKMVSFARQGNDATSSSFRDACTAAASNPTPSWEYYNAAAEEVMPLYHVELAKSGRGACSQTGKRSTRHTLRRSVRNLGVHGVYTVFEYAFNRWVPGKKDVL
jgi:hypothetical protein